MRRPCLSLAALCAPYLNLGASCNGPLPYSIDLVCRSSITTLFCIKLEVASDAICDLRDGGIFGSKVNVLMCSSYFIYTREAALSLLRCACVLCCGVDSSPFPGWPTFYGNAYWVIISYVQIHCYSLSSKSLLSFLLGELGAGFGMWEMTRCYKA